MAQIERTRELAQMAGITIGEDELVEVTNRLESLLRELEKLDALDLASIQPVTVFPEESDRGG